MNKLPDKPSELIRLAIKDLEKVEAEPDKYRVDMSIWYDKYDGQPCLVCLAGAVSAQSLGLGSEVEDWTFRLFDGDSQKKLTALNDFRVGAVEDGLFRLDIVPPEPFLDEEDRDFIGYEENRDLFVEQMLTLADDLEAEGL